MGKKLYQAPLLSSFGTIGNLTRSLASLRRLGPPSAQGSSVPSDRNIKEQFTPIEPAVILNRLAEMPITTWSDNGGGTPVRHIGPTAQAFSAAFGVGTDEKQINTVDANGVALAAIQALYQMIQERDGQVAELRAEIDALKNNPKH